MLGFAQDEAKKALSDTPQKLAIRACESFRPYSRVLIELFSDTRKTHQAILSEPVLVYPNEESSAHAEPLNDQIVGLKRLRDDIAAKDEIPPSKRIKP